MNLGANILEYANMLPPPRGTGLRLRIIHGMSGDHCPVHNYAFIIRQYRERAYYIK